LALAQSAVRKQNGAYGLLSPNLGVGFFMFRPRGFIIECPPIAPGGAIFGRAAIPKVYQRRLSVVLWGPKIV
jgi:hypothetical protein